LHILLRARAVPYNREPMRTVTALALTVAAALAVVPAVPAAADTHGSGSGPPVSQPVCGLMDRAVQEASGGVWVLSRANAFDTSGQKLCVQPAADGRPGFRILNSLRYTGAWQAYPFTGVGCAYYLCSPGTKLPRQVWRLPASLNTSWTWRGRSRGAWNAAYDIWFDDSNQISTEDDGAELMIWLKPTPNYHPTSIRAWIGQRWYWFTHWRTCDRARICWNYLQFRFPQRTQSVRNLPLMPFFEWCIRHGLIQWRWWLTSIHAGYELVSGGAGLMTTWFNVHM
jgi:hypothetical protein